MNKREKCPARLFGACGFDEAHCVCEETTEYESRLKTANGACADGCEEGCACSRAANEQEADPEARAGLLAGLSWRDAGTLAAAALLLIVSIPLAGWPKTAALLASYLLAGYEVLLRAGKGLLKGRFFDENVLMSVATIGALALGDFAEAAAVMIFYGVGETLQETAVRRSRGRIAGAVALRPDMARRVGDDGQREVKPEEIAVGEQIFVRVGERIPLDGVVTGGTSQLDVSALTGEPRPAQAAPGVAVQAGSVNTSGPLTIRVTRPAAESSTSRLLRAVEDAAAHKPAIERFITRFSRWYTPAVTVAAVLVAVLPPLFGAGTWNEWIRRALIFLVISCPCALVLSIPLTFFAGLAVTSKQGVLFKGADALERLPRVKAAVFDKTGTLTEGEFEVQRVESAALAQDELLALAAAAERHSPHPIATAIAKADPRGYATTDVRETAGKGVVARVNDRRVVVGSRALLRREGIAADSAASVLVAVDGEYAGAIFVGDRVRASAEPAVAALNRMTGYTAILTGDGEAAAREVGGALGVTEAFGALQPEEKLETLRKIRRRIGPTLFVGDGINDAPVLAGADIGVAIGLGGTDMAAEAADALLLTGDLTRLPFALDAAKRTVRTAKTNIAIALGIKTAALVLGALGLAGMWIAVLADVGAALICVLHTLTLFLGERNG